MLVIRLPAEIDERLAKLAKRTGHTKSYHAREAVLRYIDDMEDTCMAIERLMEPGRRLTMKEVEKELGMEG